MQSQASATSIQILVRRETLNLRAIDRIIQSRDFEDAWKRSTTEQREQLLKALGNKDLDSVRIWLRSTVRTALADLSYRELRDLAQGHLIPRYSRLDKEQLILQLQQRGYT